MSEQSLELLARIRRRLQAASRRITLADLLFGAATTIGLSSLLWLLSTAVEAGFWLEAGFRTVLFWIVVAASGGAAAYYVLVPLLRIAGIVPGPSAEHLAGKIGERFPEIGDRLVNLLDLSQGRRSDAPEELVDRAVQMLGRDVEPVTFEDVADFSRARRALRIAGIPIVSLLLFLAAAPDTFISASHRLLSPGAQFDQPAPFRLQVEPGTVEIARGAALNVRVEAVGDDRPQTLSLEVNHADEDHVDTIRLTADSTGSFQHHFASVRRSFRYRASATPVTSRWYETSVVEYPVVQSLQATLQFPSYADLPPRRLDPNVGDISGLPGTRVELNLSLAGSDATSAAIRFDDDSTVPLELDGDRATGSFTLTREGSYQIMLENDRGISNRDPIRYAMDLQEDAVPSVVIVRPGTDAVLTDALERLIETRIIDDYGFRDLTLNYRLAESRFKTASDSFSTIDLPVEDKRRLDQVVTYDWDLGASTPLDPVPGDIIEYFVRVRDNDTFAGYKSAETPRHRLRLPSLAEQYEQLDQEQEAAESQVESMLEEARRIDEQFRQLRDEVRRKQDGDWEDQRQIEQIQERQQQLENRVDDLSRQMESINESARRNDLLSPETLEMYEEMQHVVEEINSPELQEALEQLRQSIENLDLSQMQQAIENFEFNEDQYRRRLERTLELFKNLRAQQRLEEAARRAEEIARQQEELSEETGSLMEEMEEASPSPDPSDRNAAEENPSDRNASDDEPSDAERLAQQQERSREEMERLEELLREAQQQLEEMRRGPAREMQELNESLRQRQMPEQMQDNAQQLRREQLQDARSGQQQMQQQMQQLQQRLQQMQSSMQGSQMDVNLAGLRRVLGDVLTLSHEQESLRAALRGTVSDAPALREDARKQVELSEGLSTVVDSLRQLGGNIPQLSREVQRLSGQALREMGAATEAMSERAVGEASGYQTAAMMNMNELALLLSDVLNQLMNQSGSGDGQGNMQQMIQQMQQMAEQQQQLNQQIQEFLNDVQGNRLSVDMQERLQQMGAQQQAIKRQLDQLRRNPEARGKLLGDLGRIAEQMEETIQELQRRQVEPRTVERQRQILQRLLDAQRSLNERGQEQRREAQEGEDIIRESPADLSPEEAAEKLRRDLIRALDSGYAADYEELIKRYFDLLQQRPAEVE